MKNLTLFFLLAFVSSAPILAKAYPLETKVSNNVFVDKAIMNMGAIPASASSTLQLFTHGRPGQLLIDGKWRNPFEIVSYLLTNKVLAKGTTHINVYGCQFAKGAKGAAAVQYLETMLGISVSASTNITGKDGDWILEIGNVINTINLPEYQGNLQCENVNTTATWTKRGTTANSIAVYYDGTQTRLANTASSNARIADATTVDYEVALYKTATILPTATGTVNVTVGQSQTISAIYRAPQSDQWGVNWMIGWANSNTFNGANYNSQGDDPGNWAATVSIVNQAGASSVFLGYTDPLTGFAGNATIVYASDGFSPSPVFATGDSISLTLIPRTGGTTDLQLVIYRPSQKLLLFEQTIQNVLNTDPSAGGGSGGNGLKALYPAVSIRYGATNMGCIRVTTQTQPSPSLPNSGTCGTGISSPWQANSADPNYKMYNDGTQTRLALKTNNSRVTSSAPHGGPTSFDQASVNQTAADLSAGDTSSVSTTFLAPNDASWNQRWILGWAYSPSFTGANPNYVDVTVNTAFWATNLYIQGNELRYYDYNLYGFLIFSDLRDGDKIIGKLFQAVNGTGADLQVFVYRPSIDGIVFEKYIQNVLTTSDETDHDIYAAVSIGNGEVNLSCIGSGISSFSTLPVKLISFNGSLQSGFANLQWKTGTEDNFNHFELEKSIDGQSFTKVAEIAAKGSDSDYDYSLAQPELKAFYRLKIVDKDGKFTFSNILRLSQSINSVGLQLYPNPARDYIVINVSEEAVVRIYNAAGRLEKNVHVKKGVNTINISSLPCGIYLCGSNGNYSKFVKL